MKTLNEDQVNNVLEAIRSAHALCSAGIEDNGSTCGCYHIKPFKTHWDEKTVIEVAESVRIYVRSWILSPLSEVFNVSESNLDAMVKIRRLENEINKLKAQMNSSKDSTL